MSHHLKLVLALAGALVLAGCAQEGEYPVSGEQCGPDDAVQQMDASDFDCIPPAG